MKKFVKFFSFVMVASALLVSCNPTDDPNEEPDQPVTYTVTVNTNDATLGTASIAPLQESYLAGDVVTLTATPAANANFIGWNDGSMENPRTYTVQGNATFTANFEAKPVASWSATFDGAALDVAGWGEGMTNGQIWLFQCAKQHEGNSVYFPYIVLWLQGTSQSNLTAESLELYKDTYYTSGDEQYGDWQLFQVNNFNVTSLDLTSYEMSMTLAATMYSLTDVVENGASTDGSDATHKDMALTMSNVPFPMVSKAAMHKMNVR